MKKNWYQFEEAEAGSMYQGVSALAEPLSVFSTGYKRRPLSV